MATGCGNSHQINLRSGEGQSHEQRYQSQRINYKRQRRTDRSGGRRRGDGRWCRRRRAVHGLALLLLLLGREEVLPHPFRYRLRAATEAWRRRMKSRLIQAPFEVFWRPLFRLSCTIAASLEGGRLSTQSTPSLATRRRYLPGNLAGSSLSHLTS